MTLYIGYGTDDNGDDVYYQVYANIDACMKAIRKEYAGYLSEERCNEIKTMIQNGSKFYASGTNNGYGWEYEIMNTPLDVDDIDDDDDDDDDAPRSTALIYESFGISDI